MSCRQYLRLKFIFVLITIDVILKWQIFLLTYLVFKVLSRIFAENRNVHFLSAVLFVGFIARILRNKRWWKSERQWNIFISFAPHDYDIPQTL